MAGQEAADHGHGSYPYISAALVDSKLRGIEEELRALRSLIERLVRVEERQAQNQSEINALRADHSDLARELTKKIDAAALAGSRSTWSIDRFERIGWILVAAIAAWFGAKFQG